VKPGRRSGKPATNRLSYDTAFEEALHFWAIVITDKYGLTFEAKKITLIKVNTRVVDNVSVIDILGNIKIC
jgi:hypothetical protein